MGEGYLFLPHKCLPPPTPHSSPSTLQSKKTGDTQAIYSTSSANNRRALGGGGLGQQENYMGRPLQGEPEPFG